MDTHQPSPIQAETQLLETLYYAPPPSIPPPKNLFKGLSPHEPPVPTSAWLVIEPVLQTLGLYVPPDSTHGRYLVPPLPEERYLDESALVHTTRRRLFTSPAPAAAAADGSVPPEAESVRLTQAELDAARGREWIFYKTWELRDRRGKVGDGCDVLVVHGIGDYGGRWSIHVDKFVSAGFRVISPDLPAHGHSSGLHCYIPSMDPLTDCLRRVLDDVRARDGAGAEGAAKQEKPRKVFLAGASLGGFICLKYLLKYPPVNKENHNIDGLFLMCPLITISPETRPSYALELMGRALQSFMGRVPIAKAQRGKGHKDPRVELSFLANPQPYHGPLRIATGLTIANALVDFEKEAPAITVPIKAVHGADDRITNPKSTEQFVRDVSSVDKEVEIWPGFEHVMNAVGYDKEMDAPRQQTLKSWFDWVVKHA